MEGLQWWAHDTDWHATVRGADSGDLLLCTATSPLTRRQQECLECVCEISADCNSIQPIYICMRKCIEQRGAKTLDRERASYAESYYYINSIFLHFSRLTPIQCELSAYRRVDWSQLSSNALCRAACCCCYLRPRPLFTHLHNLAPMRRGGAAFVRTTICSARFDAEACWLIYESANYRILYCTRNFASCLIRWVNGNLVLFRLQTNKLTGLHSWILFMIIYLDDAIPYF